MRKIRLGSSGRGILVCMFVIFDIEPVHGNPIGQGIQGECGNSHSDNTHGKAEPRGKRHAGKSRRHRAPRLERNRLDEGKSSRKKPVAKNRKLRKASGKKRSRKRKGSPVSSEDSIKSPNKTNRV